MSDGNQQKVKIFVVEKVTIEIQSEFPLEEENK